MDFALKLLLKQKASYKLIAEFCLIHNKYCSENSQYVCKKILQINGYKKFNEDQDYCLVYKELSKYSSKDKSKPLEMNIKLANTISRSALVSRRLINFLKVNGHDLSTINKSMSNLFMGSEIILNKRSSTSTVKLN